jgi:NADPH:quinone reductase-like Zn-dependent oxidoreductase
VVLAASATRSACDAALRIPCDPPLRRQVQWRNRLPLGRSASVNPVDWKIVAGHLDAVMNVELPAIPGWDVSGVVESVGLDTPELAVGDEVIAYAREDWVRGGTYAELVTAPPRTVARKPQALDWHQAAGLPLAGLTAYTSGSPG